jgi:peroxiredoxin
MRTGPTYAEQRHQLQQEIAGQAPAELVDGFTSAAARLDALDFGSRAPQVGGEAPDFALPAGNGESVRLSALLRRGPVVLIFYRGEWCPYCNLQLRTFQAHLAEFEQHGAQVVAVSPQKPDHSLSMMEKNELGFLVLSDVGGTVLERYGLKYEVDAEVRSLLESVGNDVSVYNGAAGWALPAPATFLIDQRGDVRYAHVRGDWTERAEPSEVLAILADLG